MRQSKRHQQSGTKFFSHFRIEMTSLAYDEGFLFQHQLITRTALLPQYRDHILPVKPGIPQAALHRASQHYGNLMGFIYFISTLAFRCLRCGVNLSAHHSLDLSSHAALHRGFTASR